MSLSIDNISGMSMESNHRYISHGGEMASQSNCTLKWSYNHFSCDCWRN